MEFNNKYSEWNKYLVDSFSDQQKYSTLNREEKDTYYFTVKPAIFKKDRETYIRFEIDNLNKKRLKKIEFGSFDNQSTSLGFFNSNKRFCIEFLPKSFTEPSGKEYGCEFNSENILNLLKVLEIPLKKGWNEEQFYFKNRLFKTKVFIKIENEDLAFEIESQGMGEQDIPLPFDKMTRVISSFFIHLLGDKKKIRSEMINVEPILKNE